MKRIDKRELRKRLNSATIAVASVSLPAWEHTVLETERQNLLRSLSDYQQRLRQIAGNADSETSNDRHNSRRDISGLFATTD